MSKKNAAKHRQTLTLFFIENILRWGYYIIMVFYADLIEY